MSQLVLWLFFSTSFVICMLDDVSCNTDISSHNANRLYNTLRSQGLTQSLTYDNIEKIDVNCDQNSGMLVTIDFAEYFNGTIYSQGYYDDPKCRFVNANSNERRFNFNVPYEGCGSKPACDVCASVDNILIIQYNDNIQDELSTARKITCDYGNQREKTVFFKPFVVDMLEVIKVETSSGSVECWMDIGLGVPPNLSPITSSLKLGQDLTFTINIKQKNEKWDVNILRCYAYDDPNFRSKTVKILQISDENGCSLQKHIFGEWRKLETDSAAENTLTYYNSLKVFKFPDRPQVFLKCDIELCSGVCQRKYNCNVDANVKEPSCYPGSKEPKCKLVTTPTVSPGVTKSLGTISPSPKCFIGSTDPSCPQDLIAITTTVKPGCYYGSTDPSCQQLSSLQQSTTNEFPLTTPTNCYPGSNDPDCKQTDTDYKKLTKPENNLIGSLTSSPDCSSKSTDPICNQTPKTTTQSALQCFAGSKDPECIKLDYSNPKFPSTEKSTKAPSYLPPETKNQFIDTTKKPICNAGSTDPKCVFTPNPIAVPSSATKKDFAPISCKSGSSDPRCQQTTSDIQRCYPGSRDPSCLQTTQKPDCLPGSRDSECQELRKNTEETSCFPGSNDPKCLKLQTCYPGSTDYRCIQAEKSTKAPQYLPPTTRGRITSKTPTCYPGSTDPKCRETTTTTVQPCFPGSSNPNCKQTTKISIKSNSDLKPSTLKPSCYPGSKDPRCPQIIQTTPNPSPEIITLPKSKCLTGSTDPECLNCFEDSLDPRCINAIIIPTQDCYPGSTDSRCSQVVKSTKAPQYLPPTTGVRITSKTTTCYPGSTDPKCRETTTTTVQPCFPGSANPNCKQTTKISIKSNADIKPSTLRPSCYPGSKDPRCPQIIQTTPNPTTERTTLPNSKCLPGSTDPECLNCFEDSLDPRCINAITIPTSDCYPGSNSSKCQLPTNLPSTTTEKSVLPSNVPNCFTGSTDPRCDKVSPRPKLSTKSPQYLPPTTRGRTTSKMTTCYPGSTDSKCRETTTTTVQPCYPGSSNPNCKQTTKISIIFNADLKPSTLKPRCYPGSKDPICRQITQTTPNPTTERTTLPNSKCLPGSTDPECLNCFEDSLDPRCINAITIPTPDCYPGSNSPKCQLPTNLPSTTTEKSLLPSNVPNCFTASTDPRCDKVSPKTKLSTKAPQYLPPTTRGRTTFKTTACYPGSTDPTCRETTITTVQPCYPGSSNSNCKQPTKIPIKSNGDQKPSTVKPSCYAGSKDPRCPQIIQTTPNPTTERIILPKSKCLPGSTDPECLNCLQDSLDPRCINAITKPTSDCSNKRNCQLPTNLPATTTEKSLLSSNIPNCYTGSTDPRCSKVNQKPKLSCHFGSEDPRCTNDLNSDCYPGSNSPKCQNAMYLPPVTTDKALPQNIKPMPKCLPGSEDPMCSNCFPGSPDPKCPKVPTTAQPGCYSGSKSSKCQPATYLPPLNTVKALLPTRIPKTTQRPRTTEKSGLTTSVLMCYTGSTDPRCVKPTVKSQLSCYPGSEDPKCLNVPKSKTKVTTSNSDCYPGSKSPKCQSATYLPPLTTEKALPQTYIANCLTGSTDPRCTNTSPPPKPTCYPGSLDPRCKNKVTIPNSDCYPGSNNPKCQLATYLPPTTTEKAVPQTTISNCLVGSTDPRCTKTNPPQKLACYPGSADPRCKTKPTMPIFDCYPGSKSPKCQLATYLPPTTTEKGVPQTTIPNCLVGSNDQRCTKTNPPQKPACYPGSSDPRCKNKPTTPNFVEDCYPGSKSLKCQLTTYLPPTITEKTVTQTTFPNCLVGSSDPRCTKTNPSKKPACYPGSLDPGCTNKTTKPSFDCYPGSKSPKCQFATYLPPTTTEITVPKTTIPNCLVGSTDPRCTKRNRPQQPDCYPGSSDQKCKNKPTAPNPDCYPGSKSPVCQQSTYLPPSTEKTETPTNIPNCLTDATDPRCVNKNLKPQVQCYPGSSDLKCLNCFAGSPDPRCPKVPTTPKPGCFPGSKSLKCQPATYLPPTTTAKSILRSTISTTTRKPKLPCSPGSTNCPNNEVPTSASLCNPGSTDPRCTTSSSFSTSPKPNCYSGSKDPRCPQIMNFTAKPTEVIKTKCLPGSLDPDCLNCFPGSTDQRCNNPTTPKPLCYPGSNISTCQSENLPPSSTERSAPSTDYPKLTEKSEKTPNIKPLTACYPGSIDPKCSGVSSTTPVVGCRPGSNDPRCNQITTRKPETSKPTTPYYCYPGSIDPRCPDAGYKGTSRFPATYLPPIKEAGYDRTIRASKLNFLNGINKLALNDDVFIDDDEDEALEENQFLHSRNKRNVKTKYEQVDSEEQQVIYFTLGVKTALTVS